MSLTAIAILALWLVLYRVSTPESHAGAFFGNAIADWTGVVFIVIGTKFLVEQGSVESRQVGAASMRPVVHFLQVHSLTIFLVVTGVGWLLL